MRLRRVGDQWKSFPWCLILFLTSILLKVQYFPSWDMKYDGLILFLTKHLLFTFHRAFSRNFFSIAKVNIRFIHMHSCLGSILNVFHNRGSAELETNGNLSRGVWFFFSLVFYWKYSIFLHETWNMTWHILWRHWRMTSKDI
jgi:hypothetical protein